MCHRDAQENMSSAEQQQRPTMRAPDLGWAPRFLSFFLA